MVLPDFTQWLNQILNGDLLGASLAPYFSLLGGYFYLFFAILLSVPLAIKTNSIVPPSILMLLFSGIILATTPVETHKIAYLLLLLGIAGLLYRLLSGKET